MEMLSKLRDRKYLILGAIAIGSFGVLTFGEHFVFLLLMLALAAIFLPYFIGSFVYVFEFMFGAVSMVAVLALLFAMLVLFA